MTAKPDYPPLEPDHAASLRGDPRLTELRRRLLDIGGNEVAFVQPEPYPGELLARGCLHPKRGLRPWFIPSNQCRANAASLWYGSGGRIRVATGYSIGMCGLWVCHSWGVDDGRIVETTSSRWRDAYYGFEMTDRESLRLAFENLGPGFIERVRADAQPGSWVGELVKGFVAESRHATGG
jgi:hypothetical protein